VLEKYSLWPCDGLAGYPASPSGLSAKAWRWLALEGILDVFLQITVARLDFALGVLNLPFLFQVLVANYFASDFLHFAFRFFDAAFDLIFVHDDLLVMTVEDGSEHRIQYPMLILNKNKHKTGCDLYGSPHSDSGATRQRIQFMCALCTLSYRPRLVFQLF
jgi:hypothetical protein